MGAGDQTLCGGLLETAASPGLAASASDTSNGEKSADLGAQGAVWGFVAFGVNCVRAPGSLIGGRGGGLRAALVPSLVLGDVSGEPASVCLGG